MNHQKTPAWLVPCLLVAAVFVIVNPLFSLDVMVASVALVVVGHVFLQEKLLLAFVVVRPAVDFLRDTPLFFVQETTVNVNAALSILFIIWACFILATRIDSLRRLPVRFPLAAMTLLMLASVLYSVSPVQTLIESMKFIAIVLFFILGYFFVAHKHIRMKDIVSATVLAAIVPVLIGLGQVVLGAGISTFDIHGRIFGTFAHPNVFAFFLLALLFVFTHFAMIDRLDFFEKRAYMIPLGFALLGGLLLLTYTRAAWIGFAVFIIVIGVLKFQKMLLIFISTTAAFYLLFYPVNAVVIDVTGNSLTEYSFIARLTTRSEDADSIAWRGQLLRENIPIIIARPVLGYGYGTFPFVWEHNRGLHHAYDNSAEAHNDYLRLAVELGVAGLILYGLILGLFLLRAILAMQRKEGHLRKATTSIFFLGWIIVFGLVSASDNMLNHTPVMWLTMLWWGAVFAMQDRKGGRPNLLG
jgi:putative inorganic carbon (hco3(-)) transporter